MQLQLISASGSWVLLLLHSPDIPTKPLEPDYLKSPTQYDLANQAEGPCHPLSVRQGSAAWASESFICALIAEACQFTKDSL